MSSRWLLFRPTFLCSCFVSFVLSSFPFILLIILIIFGEKLIYGVSQYSECYEHLFINFWIPDVRTKDSDINTSTDSLNVIFSLFLHECTLNLLLSFPST